MDRIAHNNYSTRIITITLLLVSLCFYSPVVYGEQVDVRISNGIDDVEQIADGSIYVDSSDIELINDGTVRQDQVVGLRFRAVQIPNSATITNAYLEFTVNEAGANATSLSITAQDSDNAPAFSTTPLDVSNRPMLSTAVSWDNIVPWNTKGDIQQTLDISPLVQQIVDKSGWLNGNSMVFIITGSGTRTAESYEGLPSAAALLHVEYSTNTTATYFRIKNRAENSYLYDNGDQVANGSIVESDQRSHWEFVDTEGYKRIRNRSTGEYLHIENLTGYVECTAAALEGWHSGHWTFEDNGDYKRIRNRWKSTFYINTENQLGYAEYSTVQAGWLSADWMFEAVTNTPSLPIVTITAPDNSASESGPDNGTFRVSRVGDTTADLQVSLEIFGSAQAIDWEQETSVLALDDQNKGVVIIPEGSDSMDIVMVPVVDDLTEGMETLILSIQDQPNIYQTGTLETATITIADNPTQQTTYYRIKNRWKNTYLYDNGDPVADGSIIESDQRSHWEFIDTEGYKRIRNRSTGEYLHIENLTGYVECTAAALEGWHSGHWALEDSGDYKRIRNRWKSTFYINTENQLGFAEYSTVQDGWHSADWTFEAVTDSQNPEPDPQLPIVTITAPDDNASEIGPDNGVFRVSRTGDVSSDLIILLETYGTVQKSEWDHASSALLLGAPREGFLTIPAGSSSADIIVVPIDDGRTEGPKTLILAIKGCISASCQIGTPEMATITITDTTDPYQAQYYRVRNRWKNTYLYVDGDKVADGDIEANDRRSHWRFQYSDEYRFIRNRETSQRMNIENLTGYVECTTTVSTSNPSALWFLEEHGDYVRIGNRLHNTYYINTENQLGYAEYSTVLDGWHSADWILEAVIEPLPIVSITALDDYASEIGQDTGTFRVSRSGDTKYDFSVFINMGGALLERDWTQETIVLHFANLYNGVVHIPAGSAFADVVLVPVIDFLTEGTEWVIFSIDMRPTIYEMSDQNRASIAITDWIVTQTSYYRIKNRFGNTYLYDNDDQVADGDIVATDQRSHWEFVDYDGHKRFRNRATENFMHIENLMGYVECTNTPLEDWHSGHWSIEDHGDYKRIRNRKENIYYINTENQLGYAEYSTVQDGWESADWTFEVVVDPEAPEPELPDSDNDGMLDAWELEHFGNLSQGPDDDEDGDGVRNLIEYQLNSDPKSKDLPGTGIFYEYDELGRIKRILNIPN